MIFVSTFKLIEMILFSKHILIFVFFALFNWSSQKDSFTITVHIENLSSNDGKVMVALYDKEENFLAEGIKGHIADIEDNSCTVVFKDIPKGVYAISYIHDENANGEMDTNFMGVPKEGYGCSNNAKGFMGPPKWSDAKFELSKNLELTIN